MDSSPPDIEGVAHRYVEIETADAGRLRVHYAEAGSGEPVLMLHGWPQHFWSWRHVIPRLADRHRLICPDLRGFGWTGTPALDPASRLRARGDQRCRRCLLCAAAA